jgi:DNA-binding NarL/FixJ family response regulator
MLNDTALARGYAALREGRWEEARAALEEALRETGTPDALVGLGDAHFWLGDIRKCVDYREQAYATYRRTGNILGAAESAVWLCMIYESALGNLIVSRAWLSRAERLLEDVDAGPLGGWLWLAKAMYGGESPETRALLEKTVKLARELGDPDLELCALGELGVYLVKAGEVEEGLRCVDEAMAGALAGERTFLDTVVITGCAMLTVCELLADVDRVTQWSRAADEFTRRYGSPYLYAHCRVTYGRVLVLIGRWEEAEAELERAAAATRETFPGMHNRTVATLAELRLRQGRYDEAQGLIESVDAPVETALAAAGLALRRAEPDVAAALAERWLHTEADEVSPPFHSGGRGASIETAQALCLLVEAWLAAGDVEAVEQASARLAALAAPSGSGLMAAHAALARGRVALARGENEVAARYLEEAVRRFGRLELPLEAARSRAELARALAPLQRSLAVSEGRGSLAMLDRLGASGEADVVAALLRSWGAGGRTGRRDGGVLTRREQEILSLVAAGLSNQEIAQRLYISRKTAAHHVSNVLAKLGVRNRAEAAGYAARAGSGRDGAGQN